MFYSFWAKTWCRAIWAWIGEGKPGQGREKTNAWPSQLLQAYELLILMLNFILPMCTGGVQLEEKAGAPPSLWGSIFRSHWAENPKGHPLCWNSWCGRRFGGELGRHPNKPKRMRRQISKWELAKGSRRVRLPLPACWGSVHHQAAKAGP